MRLRSFADKNICEDRDGDILLLKHSSQVTTLLKTFGDDVKDEQPNNYLRPWHF